MSTERIIREVAAKHGLAVEKRITTGDRHSHFAAFDVYGERDAVYAAHRELVPNWSGIRPQVRGSDAEPGQVYLLLESVWCVVLNPNCDGGRCISDNGEVRVLPTGGGGNLLLCRQCFEHEKRAMDRLDNWDNLKPYQA